ncbi:hypothetical protein ACO2Q8_28370 [Larkinella sp. VNQ87]|uniref:hypothetical protein n=1 Tax=Larkinella sp. VNQ87 TaxID=3400921 RepID=UPI003C04A399
MNQLTQTRKWPSPTLSRWQIVQLSMLSALLAGMIFWKVQYDQILPPTQTGNPLLSTFASADHHIPVSKTMEQAVARKIRQ